MQDGIYPAIMRRFQIIPRHCAQRRL